MLLTKIVKIKWNPKNRKWYESRGYIFTNWKDEFEVKVEDVALGSIIKIQLMCDYCKKNIINIRYVDYIKNNKTCIVQKDACSKCGKIKLSDVFYAKYKYRGVLQIPEKRKNLEQIMANKFPLEKVLKAEKFRNTYAINNNTWTYKKVKEYIEKLGYILFSIKYINVFDHLIVMDKDNYYYFTSFQTFLDGKIPNKFHKSNPYTIQNIKLWCKLNNKSFELISEKYEGNNKKLQWKCLKDGCGEIFNKNLSNVIQNQGCPYCVGQKVGLSNCLAIKRPDIAKEWHPTKNGNLTPYDVTCGNSRIYIWWQCNKNPKHEWKAKINNRNSNNSQCPYCAGFYPSEDYNLLIYNPKLCEEWDYNKNDKKPEEYTPNSNNKVWWICKECGNKWFALISSRNCGRGCSYCNISKGENKIKEIFNLNNFIEIKQKDYEKLIVSNSIIDFKYYISQKTFDGLIGIGNGLLSYDFYIPKYNCLIEYQGEFHDGSANQQSEKQFKIQQEHDKRKRKYAKNNNIKLLEIWYYDFDNIKEILDKELPLIK